MAATSHNKVQLINVATLEVHKSLNKFKETCFSGRFRHDGGLLCAGTGEGAVDGEGRPDAEHVRKERRRDRSQ